MELANELKKIYPELTSEDFYNKVIWICNDGDGVDYIHEWNYFKPLPKDFKIGK